MSRDEVIEAMAEALANDCNSVRQQWPSLSGDERALWRADATVALDAALAAGCVLPGIRKEPDPRFLGGETAVITDTSEMALCIAIGWDGAADITANVDKKEAARLLRHIANQWD